MTKEARALVAVSVALLAVRLFAATRVGFGDSEALYACYAIHQQPAYLDHPGLIGVLARTIAQHSAPSPSYAHVVTAILATAVPWLVVLAGRAAGGARAGLAGLAVALVPEIAIGLFAMTPDLLLALAWTASLACACAGLRADPRSARAAVALVGAGLFAGIATAAKVSGVALVLSLAATYVFAARRHARTAWPWIGLGAGAIVVLPIVVYEARSGWPMLVHRLVATQSQAGVSLRNAGALLGGQLLYLSPLVAFVAVLVALDLVRARRTDATSTLLFLAFAIPLVVLLPLCLWSRVAEPHWIAPALLALPIHFSRASIATSRRLGIAALATSAAMVAAAHVWVLAPALVRAMPASFDATRDITSELYGWPDALAEVRRVVIESRAPGSERRDLVVVGPHWVVCAQLEAALSHYKGAPPVGCATPIRDDFDDWYARDKWQRAETLVFVTDTRFAFDAAAFPKHVEARREEVRVERGGRTARVFTIVVLARRTVG